MAGEDTPRNIAKIKITLEPAPPETPPTSTPHDNIALRAPELNSPTRITDIAYKPDVDPLAKTTKDKAHTIKTSTK